MERKPDGAHPPVNQHFLSTQRQLQGNSTVPVPIQTSHATRRSVDLPNFWSTPTGFDCVPHANPEVRTPIVSREVSQAGLLQRPNLSRSGSPYRKPRDTSPWRVHQSTIQPKSPVCIDACKPKSPTVISSGKSYQPLDQRPAAVSGLTENKRAPTSIQLAAQIRGHQSPKCISSVSLQASVAGPPKYASHHNANGPTELISIQSMQVHQHTSQTDKRGIVRNTTASGHMPIQRIRSCAGAPPPTSACQVLRITTCRQSSFPDIACRESSPKHARSLSPPRHIVTKLAAAADSSKEFRSHRAWAKASPDLSRDCPWTISDPSTALLSAVMLSPRQCQGAPGRRSNEKEGEMGPIATKREHATQNPGAEMVSVQPLSRETMEVTCRRTSRCSQSVQRVVPTGMDLEKPPALVTSPALARLQMLDISPRYVTTDHLVHLQYKQEGCTSSAHERPKRAKSTTKLSL